jgi:large conductance mechanosensitive channel
LPGLAVATGTIAGRAFPLHRDDLMRLPLSGLWAEFKAFAFKGNMIELAVAVVIGAAFGKVINSLVDDVIMPSVTYVVQTTHKAAVSATEVVEKSVGVPTTQPTTAPATATVASATPPAPAPAPAAAPAPPPANPSEAVNLQWDLGPVHIGRFIGSLINFMLIAAAVFLMIVKLLGGVMKKMSKPAAASEPTTRECPECLSLIPIKAKRCSHCTAVITPPVIAPPSA